MREIALVGARTGHQNFIWALLLQAGLRIAAKFSGAAVTSEQKLKGLWSASGDRALTVDQVWTAGQPSQAMHLRMRGRLAFRMNQKNEKGPTLN
jgi:hypothetical protein